MEGNKGFIVDVKVSICFPLDDETICIPNDEGLHLLKNEEIPVCDQRALVNFKSMHLIVVYLWTEDIENVNFGNKMIWTLLSNWITEYSDLYTVMYICTLYVLFVF